MSQPGVLGESLCPVAEPVTGVAVPLLYAGVSLLASAVGLAALAVLGAALERYPGVGHVREGRSVGGESGAQTTDLEVKPTTESNTVDGCESSGPSGNWGWNAQLAQTTMLVGSLLWVLWAYNALCLPDASRTVVHRVVSDGAFRTSLAVLFVTLLLHGGLEEAAGRFDLPERFTQWTKTGTLVAVPAVSLNDLAFGVVALLVTLVASVVGCRRSDTVFARLVLFFLAVLSGLGLVLAAWVRIA
ncbi:hypothetical protein [Halomicrobium salinisoli]|uniref:hypothetical protein n=1 Tax=Halomicrobium salinisoli TaxID=2878391 RepID=UPI001CF09964|nr:hypothetical protein [Halomicrobium salinisoli]